MDPTKPILGKHRGIKTFTENFLTITPKGPTIVNPEVSLSQPLIVDTRGLLLKRKFRMAISKYTMVDIVKISRTLSSLQ